MKITTFIPATWYPFRITNMVEINEFAARHCASTGEYGLVRQQVQQSVQHRYARSVPFRKTGTVRVFFERHPAARIGGLLFIHAQIEWL